MNTPALPILADPTWFSSFLSKILDVSSTLLAPSAPARAFVSPGVPVPDCRQLTVHFDKVRPSQAPTRSQQSPVGTREIVTVADVMVTYFDCVPSWTQDGDIPTTSDLYSAGVRMADAAQTLWFGLLAATLDGTLFPTQVRPPVLWRDMVQWAPQSGLAGLRATMEVTLA